MLQLPSTELEQEPVSVLGRNIEVAQGWGAGSSASANWCSIILVMELHSFTYLKILCLHVCCRVSVFLLVSKYRTINWKMWGVYVTAYDITYATYSMHLSVQKMNSLYLSHSSICNPKMTNGIMVCCDTALDSDSILGLFWMGFPVNTFLWKSLFFTWVKQEAFWFLVLNYCHWSFFSCSNIQEVNFFTFILDFKL